MTSRTTSPALYGGLLALLSAQLFGLSAPLIQLAGRGVGPFTTAALLYGGAAMVSMLLRHGEWREARLQLADLRVLALMALAWGLQRTSGASASLLLTLEAVFSAVLAWRWYGESMDRRVLAALLLLLAGAALLVLEQGLGGQARALGLAAVAMATVARGLDNTLARTLADRDPAQVVLAKSALGALVLGERSSGVGMWAGGAFMLTG